MHWGGYDAMDYRKDQLSENRQPAINLYRIVEPANGNSVSNLNAFAGEEITYLRPMFKELICAICSSERSNCVQ